MKEEDPSLYDTLDVALRIDKAKNHKAKQNKNYKEDWLFPDMGGLWKNGK